MSDAEGTATLQLPETRPIPAGWRVIGAREFTEHLLSVRFIALLLVLGLAGILAIYAVAGSFRDVASQIPSTITGQKVPVFPLLFTTSPSIPGLTGQSFPSFAGLVALLGPVLGIAFGFDAISSERSEGTLPRLVSQPIHRDDVINGKFVAGLAVIAMILGAVIVMLAGVGIIQVPEAGMRPYLDAGQLCEVLPAYRPAPMPVSLLYANRRHLPRRVQVFMAWLAEQMQERVSPLA